MAVAALVRLFIVLVFAATLAFPVADAGAALTTSTLAQATPETADIEDPDGDDVPNPDDNCPDIPNPDQSDADGNGIGDACETPPADEDADDDGVPDWADNCAEVPNPDQADRNWNGIGDACDDGDGDAVVDAHDNCPDVTNPDQADADGNGVGDSCNDRDGDGVIDSADACPDAYDPWQDDRDGDGVGDACDSDIDGDSVANEADNCLWFANADQADADGDGVGDTCDESPSGPDEDWDGVPDADDNCPNAENPDQADGDGDGTGDACDPGDPVDVYVVDGQGRPVRDSGSGSCFEFWSSDKKGSQIAFYDAQCDAKDGTDGYLFLRSAPPGRYVLVQTRAAEGYAASKPVVFTVEQGTGATVQVVNKLRQALTIAKLAGVKNGKPLPGACFTVVELDYAVCDDNDGADDGTLTIALPPGSYTVTESVVPPGYLRAPDVTAAIQAGKSVKITVVDKVESRIVVTKVEQGNPSKAVLGACFAVHAADEAGAPLGEPVGQSCDSDGTEANDGTIEVDGLTVGRFVLVETAAPDGYLRAANVAFAVETAGQTISLTVEDPKGGWIDITMTDKLTGAPVYDACVRAYHVNADGTRGDGVIRGETCDQYRGGDVRDGLMVIRGLTTDAYELEMIQVPDGYFGADPIRVEVVQGVGTPATFALQPGGTVLVGKTDPVTGELVRGICFDAYFDDGSGTIAPDRRVGRGGCDFDHETGTNTGLAVVRGLPSGDYVLFEYLGTEGYARVTIQVPGVVEGQVVTKTVVAEPEGRILITVVDGNGDTIVPDNGLGACFDVYTHDGTGSPGVYLLSRCDREDAEPWEPDGTTVIRTLATGDYVVVQSGAPSDAVTFSREPIPVPGVVAGSDLPWQVTNLAPGAIAVTVVDTIDQTIQPDWSGACFAVYRDVGSGNPSDWVGYACDYYDANGADGTTVLGGLPDGNYLLVQERAPSGAYAPASGAIEVDGVAAGTVRSVTVTNDPAPAPDPGP